MNLMKITVNIIAAKDAKEIELWCVMISNQLFGQVVYPKVASLLCTEVYEPFHSGMEAES